MKNLIAFIVVITFLVSCSSTSEKENIMANTNTVLSIEGMTCETGCAKRIESKLAKLEGVKSCVVDFEKKEATIVYDDESISETKFVDLVEGLNDHQYSVSEIETEKISTTNTEVSSEGGSESGTILSAPEFELPNIVEYFRNII